MVLKSIFGVLDPCLQWSHWTPRRSFVAGLSSASLQVLHPAPFQERVMLWLRPFGVGQSQALLLRVRAGGGGLGCFRIDLCLQFCTGSSFKIVHSTPSQAPDAKVGVSGAVLKGEPDGLHAAPSSGGWKNRAVPSPGSRGTVHRTCQRLDYVPGTLSWGLLPLWP